MPTLDAALYWRPYLELENLRMIANKGTAPGERDPVRIALQAILQTAAERYSWGDAELDVWVRQIRAAALLREKGNEG